MTDVKKILTTLDAEVGRLAKQAVEADTRDTYAQNIETIAECVNRFSKHIIRLVEGQQ